MSSTNWRGQRNDNDASLNLNSYFALLSTRDEDGSEQLTPLCHPGTDRSCTPVGPGKTANSYTATTNKETLESSISDGTTYDQAISADTSVGDDDFVSGLEMPPNPIHSTPPTPSRQGRLSVIKGFFSSPIKYVSRSHSRTDSSDFSSVSSSPRQPISVSSSYQASPTLSETSSTQFFNGYVDDGYAPSLLDEASPVTPDDFDVFDSPQSESGHSPRNKGKNKAQALPFENLVDDTAEVPISSIISGSENEEWWGIEVAIQASRNERRSSVTSMESVGECSKSRESWAAIHKGHSARGLDDAKFEEWRRWHQQLEKADEQRKAKRKRTIDFMQESDRLARLYVEELFVRRILDLQSESLTDDEVYDALLWTEYASEKNPDPFLPPEKHGLAWTLKRHRSISALRDLKFATEGGQ